MGKVATRRRLWRWLGHFILVNALLLLLIGLRYLWIHGPPAGGLAWVYLAAAALGHYALLAALPLFLIGLPLIVLWPRKPLLFGAAAVVAAALLVWLYLDSLVFAENRFHITVLTAQILGVQTWLFAGIYFLIALFIESWLANWLWARLAGGDAKGRAKWLGLAAAVALVGAQLTHIWADANYYTPVTGLSQYLPGYRGSTAKSLLHRYGLVDLEQSRERQLTRRLAGNSTAGVLRYPLQPLRCQRPVQRHNLLVILVDALRWDMLTPEVMPNTWRFSERQATRFERHYSGGNSSRMGAFSFFYGISPSYFKAVEAVQQPAVLVDELQHAGYAFGVFSSGPLYRPVTLDRTAFANIPDLRLVTEPESAAPHVRDRRITRDWLAWLDRHERNRPFFGFLFYDAPTAADAPVNYPVKFPVRGDRAIDRKFADYQASVHFVDSEIQTLLEALDRQNLLQSTVVLISADHGEEFDENGLGYDQHGSAYSEYQLRVPMVLHWPGRAADTVAHRTSHNDVPPTLLQNLLGCENPPEDYASGWNLFSGRSWQWLASGSYYNSAIVTPDQVIVSFPNGLHEVRDRDYRLLESPRLDADLLTAALRENTRFYRQ